MPFYPLISKPEAFFFSRPLTTVIGFLSAYRPLQNRIDTYKNQITWLYITQYQGGNATVSDVFRYYLSGELSGDPLKAVGEMKPFLTADTGTAVVTKIGRLVTVHVKGKIYNFTNSVMYTSKDTAVFPVIELYASGEWQR